MGRVRRNVGPFSSPFSFDASTQHIEAPKKLLGNASLQRPYNGHVACARGSVRTVRRALIHCARAPTAGSSQRHVTRQKRVTIAHTAPQRSKLVSEPRCFGALWRTRRNSWPLQRWRPIAVAGEAVESVRDRVSNPLGAGGAVSTEYAELA